MATRSVGEREADDLNAAPEKLWSAWLGRNKHPPCLAEIWARYATWSQEVDKATTSRPTRSKLRATPTFPVPA